MTPDVMHGYNEHVK